MAAIHFSPLASPLKDTGATTRFSYDTTGVGFNGQATMARPDFTVTNHTDALSLNETGATLLQLANTVGTVINQLILYGIFQ